MEINIKLYEHFYAHIDIQQEANNYLSPNSLDSQNRKVNSYEIVKKSRHIKRLINVHLKAENDKKVILFEGLDVKTFSRLLIEFTNNKLNPKLEYAFENSLIFTISSIDNTPNLIINDVIHIDKISAKIMIDKLEYLYKNCSFFELELDEY